MFHLKRKYEEKIPFVKMDWKVVTYNISKYSKLTFKKYIYLKNSKLAILK